MHSAVSGPCLTRGRIWIAWDRSIVHRYRRRLRSKGNTQVHRGTTMSAAARRLFEQGTREEVASAATTDYSRCIQAMTTAKNTLAALDTFWRETLSATLRQRTESKEGAYIDKDDLRSVMKWKLSRGKNRPLLPLIESNDCATVRRVSHEAFAHLISGQGDEAARVRKAIEIMSGKSVRGVGPATASAVLAVCRPDLVPFMADEAVAAALPQLGKLKYSLDEYTAFRAAVVARARALGGGVTAEELGRAVWAVAKAGALGLPSRDGGRAGEGEGVTEQEEEKKGKGGKKRAALPAEVKEKGKKARQKK